MGYPEFGQNLNISPEVLQKEQVIPQVPSPEQKIVPPEEIEEVKEKEKIIVVSTPEPGVELKVTEGTEVDFVENMGTFEKFVEFSCKGAELKKEEEKAKKDKDIVNDVLKMIGKKVNWRGVIVKPKKFQNLIYTTEKVEVKDEQMIRKSIPKRYLSWILKKEKEIKLTFDKDAYNKLLQQGKISPLPEGAIEEKITWNIRYDPLKE
jgi:hypothetical protein